MIYNSINCNLPVIITISKHIIFSTYYQIRLFVFLIYICMFHEFRNHKTLHNTSTFQTKIIVYVFLFYILILISLMYKTQNNIIYYNICCFKSLLF